MPNTFIPTCPQKDRGIAGWQDGKSCVYKHTVYIHEMLRNNIPLSPYPATNMTPNGWGIGPGKDSLVFISAPSIQTRCLQTTFPYPTTHMCPDGYGDTGMDSLQCEYVLTCRWGEYGANHTYINTCVTCMYIQCIQFGFFILSLLTLLLLLLLLLLLVPIIVVILTHTSVKDTYLRNMYAYSLCIRICMYICIDDCRHYYCSY